MRISIKTLLLSLAFLSLPTFAWALANSTWDSGVWDDACWDCNNQAPVLTAIGNKTVAEAGTLSFAISGTDPDSDPLTYSATNLPTGASFTGQTFSWTPDYTQASVYSVTFAVSDGTATANETITITVTDVNRAPILTAIGNKNINETQTLSFTISGTDPDGDPLTYSAANLPTGASFTGRTFSWTPVYGQAGTYSGVTFTISDGTATAGEAIAITVVVAPSPSATTLSTPVNGQAGVALLPTFSWQAGLYTQTFQLQVATDLAFTQIAADIPLLTGTSYTLRTPLANGTNYYWRIVAVNPMGQTSSAIYSFITLVDVGSVQTATSTLPTPSATGVQDYRMISVPLYPVNPGVQAVLGNTFGAHDPSKWRLFRYDPVTGQYNEHPASTLNFAPGLSFWFISTQGGTFNVAGSPVDTTQPFAISLPSGWNQIGGPFTFPVDWSEVKVRSGATEVLLSDPANIWVNNILWEYQDNGVGSSGYYMKREIVPWHGYWVKNISGATVDLIIPNKAATTTVAKKSRPRGWRMNIEAVQGPSTDSDNFLGLVEGASVSLDAQDLSEPPGIGGTRLYFIHVEGALDTRPYASDIRPPNRETELFDFVVEPKDGNSPVTLSWSDSGVTSHGQTALLTDLATGEVIDMRKYSEYSFHPGNNDKLYFEIRVSITLAAAPIPTLSQWGLIFFGLLLLAGGIFRRVKER